MQRRDRKQHVKHVRREGEEIVGEALRVFANTRSTLEAGREQISRLARIKLECAFEVDQTRDVRL